MTYGGLEGLPRVSRPNHGCPAFPAPTVCIESFTTYCSVSIINKQPPNLQRLISEQIANSLK